MIWLELPEMLESLFESIAAHSLSFPMFGSMNGVGFDPRMDLNRGSLNGEDKCEIKLSKKSSGGVKESFEPVSLNASSEL